MADAAPTETTGFTEGFGGERGRGDRGRGRGRGDRGGRGGRGGRGRGRGRGDDGKKEWVPVTKLGRLVKDGKITSIEEIFLFSLPIKEPEIVDHFFGESLKDEVMKISPVQKMTQAGQRTRFRAYVAVGDYKQHIGLGHKTANEVANAIRGALINAKLSIIPVRLGYWGAKFGPPHTVPMKVSGKTGSVYYRLIPAPRGTGIVASKNTKKFLTMAGITDLYTRAEGKTKSMGNFLSATYKALTKTYGYLTPDQWAPSTFAKAPYQQWSDYLAQTKVGAAKKAKQLI